MCCSYCSTGWVCGMAAGVRCDGGRRRGGVEETCGGRDAEKKIRYGSQQQPKGEKKSRSVKSVQARVANVDGQSETPKTLSPPCSSVGRLWLKHRSPALARHSPAPQGPAVTFWPVFNCSCAIRFPFCVWTSLSSTSPAVRHVDL